MNQHLINHRPTEELVALNAAHHIQCFADGSITKGKGSRIITKAQGSTLTDSEGVDLIDGMAGLWCVNIGYGRNELADAAHRQMLQLPYYNTFFQTAHPPVVELAAKIAQLAPGDLNHVFFANSGSEANDTNIRLVRHYWATKGQPDKRVIISRHNAYHGSSIGSASLGGMKHMHAQGGLPIPDIAYINQPFWYAEGGDMDPEEFGLKCALELEAKILELGVENVAAFIGEPIQGAGGVIIPSDSYWPEIQRICQEHGILLIADEVICGFGRTGQWFGSNTYDIKADVMTIAKGLSSGYAPISASVFSDEIDAVLSEKGGYLTHGYTYSGHPMTAAVALENIRILEEEKIVETCAAETIPHFAKVWTSIADHPLVGETRTKGLLGGLTLTPDKTSRAAFDTPGEAGAMLRDHCFAGGAVLRAVGDSFVSSPPLIITNEEIDRMAAILREALDKTAADLHAKGVI